MKVLHKPRILVTAQSNVAVDEILSRVKAKGMLSNDLRPYNPDIVRVGPSSNTSEQVKEISVDSIISYYIQKYTEDSNVMTRLMNDIRHRLNPEINNPAASDEKLAALYEEFCRKKLDLERFQYVRDYKQSATQKLPQEELKQSILNEARIFSQAYVLPKRNCIYYFEWGRKWLLIHSLT